MIRLLMVSSADYWLCAEKTSMKAFTSTIISFERNRFSAFICWFTYLGALMYYVLARDKFTALRLRQIQNFESIFLHLGLPTEHLFCSFHKFVFIRCKSRIGSNYVKKMLGKQCGNYIHLIFWTISSSSLWTSIETYVKSFFFLKKSNASMCK